MTKEQLAQYRRDFEEKREFNRLSRNKVWATLTPTEAMGFLDEIERLEAQITGVRKALWNRDEYERSSASTCLAEIEAIIGMGSPFSDSPTAAPLPIELEKAP